jgi:hypothetical protein
MELTHTLEVKPNLFIRAFVKFYDLPKKDPELNTCKLFWGGLGMIFIPILILATAPVWIPLMGLVWLTERVKESNMQRRQAEREAYYKLPFEERQRIEAEKNAPKTRAEWLNKLSSTGSAVWFKIQTPVTWFFRVLIGGIALVGLAALVYLLVTTIPGLPWGEILSLAWKVLLAAIGIALILGGAIYLFGVWREKHPPKLKAAKKPSVIKAVFASIHDHTCANVKIAYEDEKAV